MHPNHVPEPPHLIPIVAEEQRLYKLPPDDGAPHTVSIQFISIEPSDNKCHLKALYTPPQKKKQNIQ